jgi:hypothetical protein
MPSPPRRAFHLMDAFFLIAATAIGFALWRGRFTSGKGCYGVPVIWDSESWISWVLKFYADYRFLATAAWPFCLPWTLTILALRLRHPRPDWRCLSRQPGAVACCAMAVACFMTAIPAFCVLRISGRTYETALGDLSSTLLLVSPYCGSAVVGAWLTLLLRSSWRADKSWIDRAGRALGVFWIGTIALPF